ncbi:solute carrier family 23 member 3 isoform X1 [Canis lupus familiaris]|uniref:solute carrier family 23 member 3 isoform X1 n=1 Tax=Canis lupus familiaris TaxID=9615 RepID=UPI0018F7D4D1|nr:solute carrier family 23 member 3 isoform X1 [Canis lupus familiaris]
MSRSPHHPIQLRSMDLQDALAPLPLSSSPLPPPLPPPQSAVQNPSSHLWASQCGPPPWGLSCLLALQHILVLASLLCASHLLLLQGLPPGELSSSPAQLLASSFFSCGVSTILQIWIGSRLPLVQAPSLEFLVPALVLTQKLPLAIQTPGNWRWPSSALLTGAWPCCTLILLVVVCSQHLGSCQVPPCPWRPASNSSPHTPIPVFRLFSVLVPVACVWIISALLGLRLIPLELAASPKAPWVWLPHPAEWTWPLLTPRALAAGISMALAASTSSLGCYALCGRLLQLPSPPPHACSRGLSLEGLGSVLAGMLGSPMGTASSFPNVGTVSLIQAGSRRVAHLVGLLCVGLGLSPRLAQLLTAIPLPVLGGVLGVTQAVVLSTGFSSFHLADIDSGRNVFIVGFSIFMALLLPRWLREAPVLMSTGWSPLDVLLRSLLTEPIFLAGLLGFLLENTIPGTRLERGLGQGMPSPFAAPKAQMPEKSREKGAKEYELPFPIQKLHPCIPQPLRCLCPLPEDPGNEEGGPSEPGETADLLPGFGEQCPESSRELGSQ